MLTLALALLLGGCAALGTASGAPAPPPVEPFRILDAAAGREIDFPTLVARLEGADVVFFGEFHDDDVASGIQLRLLTALTERHATGVLALEMFEVDVQPVIDRYVQGAITEAAFLAESRPWNNYVADYRPLVETAREVGWRVVGTNLPRDLATAIAREGLGALDTLPADRARYAPSSIACPEDGYWLRFLDAMREAFDEQIQHAPGDAMLRDTYHAQCARDEAMAESLAALIDRAPVLHINGAFHTDYEHGIVPRLRSRVPGVEIRTISAIPVEDPAAPDAAGNRGRADFLIFTPADPAEEEPATG